jgi:hypothetical protein
LLAEGPDTTRLTLIYNGSKVVGKLAWVPWEKDAAIGSLLGTISGDTIVAEYNYVQEGEQATEEKIMVREGNDILIMGGELEQRGKMFVIKDKAAMKVESRLQPTECVAWGE